MNINFILTNFKNITIFITNYTDSSALFELAMILVLMEIWKKSKLGRILIIITIYFAFISRSYEIQQAKNVKKETEKCVCGCK